MTAPSQFGAVTFAQGAITEHLQAGELPPQDSVNDAFGYASGALRFDLDLPPNAAQEIYPRHSLWHRGSGLAYQSGFLRCPGRNTSGSP